MYTASQMLKLEAPSQSSVRAPPAAGDEVPVAGVIQWYVSEDSTGKWYMHYGGRAQTRKKALEFVSGCYSPSTLNEDQRNYTHGGCYCSMDAAIRKTLRDCGTLKYWQIKRDVGRPLLRL